MMGVRTKAYSPFTWAGRRLGSHLAFWIITRSVCRSRHSNSVHFNQLRCGAYVEHQLRLSHYRDSGDSKGPEMCSWNPGIWKNPGNNLSQRLIRELEQQPCPGQRGSPLSLNRPSLWRKMYTLWWRGKCWCGYKHKLNDLPDLPTGENYGSEKCSDFPSPMTAS